MHNAIETATTPIEATTDLSFMDRPCIYSVVRTGENVQFLKSRAHRIATDMAALVPLGFKLIGLHFEHLDRVQETEIVLASVAELDAGSELIITPDFEEAEFATRICVFRPFRHPVLDTPGETAGLGRKRVPINAELRNC